MELWSTCAGAATAIINSMVWSCIVTMRRRVDAFNTPMAVSGVHERDGGVMPACSTCSVADIELPTHSFILMAGNLMRTHGTNLARGQLRLRPTTSRVVQSHNSVASLPVRHD